LERETIEKKSIFDKMHNENVRNIMQCFNRGDSCNSKDFLD